MYLTLSSPFGVENNVHEYLTKRTGLFAYWHTNGYTIICCLLMVTRCPSLTTLKMCTATKNLLFRSLRNNFSKVQTYSKHLKVCQWLNTVGYPDWWAPTWHDMHEIFTLSWLEFAETSRWLPKTFWRLQNITENVRRCSEDVWALPKLLYKTTTIFRALISLEHKKGYKVII